MKAYSKTAENNMRKGESVGYFLLVVLKGIFPHFQENLGLCIKSLIYKKNNSLTYQFHVHVTHLFILLLVEKLRRSKTYSITIEGLALKSL